MPLIRRICCCLLLIVGLGLPQFSAFSAVGHNVRFKHYTLQDGLSQAAVFAITQDAQGFIWFATQEGINRFDGYQFKNYYHDPDAVHSLSHDAVYTMLTDREGVIWLATEDGRLNRFNPLTETFASYQVNLELPQAVRINALFEDSLGQLWVGTDSQGILRFNREQLRFEAFSHKETCELLNNVQVLIEDSLKRLWIGTDSGIRLYDLETNVFLNDHVLSTAPKNLADASVRTLFFDHQNNLWIGTHNKGIVQRDSLGNYQSFVSDGNQIRGLCHNRIRDIRQDRHQQLWIATDDGLCLWHPEEQEFTAFRNNPSNEYSVIDDRGISLFEDRSGVMWLGTFGGISKWQPSSFSHFFHDEADSNSLSSNIVTAFAEDRDGNLWTGTYAGLNKLDRQNQQFSRFKVGGNPNGPELSDDRVMSLMMDSDNLLWIGTRGSGIDRYDPVSGETKNYSHDANNLQSLSGNGVTDIFQDNNDRIWVSTYGGGVDLYHPDSDSFHAITMLNLKGDLTSNRVLTLFQSHDGILWAGTEGGGINSIDLDTGDILDYRHSKSDKHSLSSDLAWIIAEDKYRNLWIGTWGGGLNKWPWLSRQKGEVKFEHIGKKQGLNSSVIYSIVPDDSGHIWVSTNRGLTRLSADLSSIRHFDYSHGLQGNEFNHGAAYKASNGQLLFGGSNGFNGVFPNQLVLNQIPPGVALTRMLRMNHELPLGAILDSLEGLTLNYQDTIFSFEFAALDFVAPELNQYRYKLEGFNDDWITIGLTRQITFSHLPAGSFVFKVQAANNDGIWNEQGFSLPVSKTPPPWRTTWAYVIYFLVALAVIVMYLRSHRKKLQEKAAYSRELEKTVQLRTYELLEANHKLEDAMEQAEAGNRSKGAFIATISHEFRTPMTSIIGFAESLQEDRVSDTERSRRLSKIRANGEHLLQLLNKVLDVSKIEMNKLQVEAIKLSPVKVLQEVSDLLEQQCRTKALSFEVHYQLPVPSEITSDPTRLKQILLNLCGNGIKFTESGGIRIHVSAEQNTNMMLFEVRDTGIGIPQDKLHTIFDSFSQVDNSTTRKYGGTGLGLSISRQLSQLLGGDMSVTSEEGTGSCFHFSISMGRETPSLWLNDMATIRNIEQRCPSQHFKVPALEGHILVAEDWHDNQELIEMYIQRTGAKVTLAENGQQAIEKGLSEHFDLVLMDVQMPVLDGVEATKFLRATGFSSPVIALTANVSSADIETYLNSGFDGHLSKPIERDAFYKILTNFLTANGSTSLENERDMEQLVEQFLVRLPELLAMIKTALDSKNWRKAKGLLHNLKGMGGSFGFSEITELVSEMEKNLIHQQWSLVITGFSSLQQIVNELTTKQGIDDRAISDSIH